MHYYSLSVLGEPDKLGRVDKVMARERTPPETVQAMVRHPSAVDEQGVQPDPILGAAKNGGTAVSGNRL